MSLVLSTKQSTRFWSKVIKTDYCWIWSGYRNNCGYGMINLSGGPSNLGGNYFVHRISYLLANPDKNIPKGWIINHKCLFRNCVNPKHLNKMPQYENTRRIGKIQQIDEPDFKTDFEVFEELDNFQKCLYLLGEEFSNVGGNDTIIEIIKRKTYMSPYTFSYELDPEEFITGIIKRKYFWQFDRILKLFKIKFSSVRNYCKIDRDGIQYE